MPRVSEKTIKACIANVKRAMKGGGTLSQHLYKTRLDVLLDLQNARAALKAIANWKARTTDEPPLTYIERVAKEVGG